MKTRNKRHSGQGWGPTLSKILLETVGDEMTKTKLQKLEQTANDYFIEANKPFSMQEICQLLDVSFQTLSEWEASDNKQVASFARSVKARVAAGWEKGELSAGLCSYLHKAYFSEQDYSEDRPLDITIRICDDGA